MPLRPHHEVRPSTIIIQLAGNQPSMPHFNNNTAYLDLEVVIGLEDTLKFLAQVNDHFRASLAPPSSSTLLAYAAKDKFLFEHRDEFGADKIAESKRDNIINYLAVIMMVDFCSMSLAMLQKRVTKMALSPEVNVLQASRSLAEAAPICSQSTSTAPLQLSDPQLSRQWQQWFVDLEERRSESLCTLDQLDVVIWNACYELKTIANHGAKRFTQLGNGREVNQNRVCVWNALASRFLKMNHSFDARLKKIGESVVVPPPFTEMDICAAIPSNGTKLEELEPLFGQV